MSSVIDFKIIGKKVIDALEVEITKQAGELVQELKSAAPRRSGKMADGFKAEIKATESGVTARVGTPVYYALFSEYGTKFTPPNGFARRAFDANSINILTAIEKATQKTIEQENSKV